MTMTRQEIGTLLIHVQDEFLDTPALKLSPRRAKTHFDADERVCAAVLEVLAEAKVLTRTRDGLYTRRPVVARAA